jgi:class 3 adenylate cyclase/tetratricopeptide (TPR) repeat protein
MAEARKTVTIVFSDVAGSTSLGEQFDAETLRRVMERYFAEMRSILERHGGTVEKFIGDAVMAVFGIPTAHEDDALRAVRAAAEMRERLAALNEDLERERGVTLAVRTGINTGEVVAGDPDEGEFYATGDAVNVAARLEQSADPGETLLGEQTYGLVQVAVRVEPVEPLTLKGKAATVAAYRLLEVIEGALPLARRFDTPFVGRKDELAALLASFDRSVAKSAPVLATVLGPAGIGKTRLAAELVSKVEGRATVLQGRCLSYGEGITFWPLQEILRSLPVRPGGAPDPEQARSTEETFWAYRKLFEALAQERPLVLVLEDIHWAEPMLLDLIEHVVEWTQKAPIMILCLARPDLLDERAGWPGERIELESLRQEEADSLVATLAAGVDPAVRARATEVAEGNPLFLEQLLALAKEDGHGLAVPDTIQALLAARLDRLDTEERSLLEAAAVVGKEFWRGAVLNLSPPGTEVSALLQRLVRRRLVQPDRVSFPGEDAFRFSHVLIRDAAYSGIAKEMRAKLHESFADWLTQSGSPYEEIVGYHLEQAYTYRAQLGPMDEALRALGDRASELLAEAGLHAMLRGDDPAAVNLLERASCVQGDPSRRRFLSLRLAEALNNVGELEQAWSLQSDVIAEAKRCRDRRNELLATIAYAALGTNLAPDIWGERIKETAENALREFEALGDDFGLARACQLAAHFAWESCRYDETVVWLSRAEAHARRIGDEWEVFQARRSRVHAMYYGSAEVQEVVRETEAFLGSVKGSPAREGFAFFLLAGLHAMAGEADEARRLYLRAKWIGEDLGMAWLWLVGAQHADEVGLPSGDAEFAERELRAAYESLESVGEQGFRSTIAAQLAEALYQLGRYEEAERFADTSFEAAGPGDIASQTKARAVKGRLLAVRGEHGAAERLTRKAVELAANTDSLALYGEALMALAEVLRLTGREHDAIPVLEQAAEVSERKGNIVTAENARAKIADLQAAAGSSR